MSSSYKKSEKRKSAKRKTKASSRRRASGKTTRLNHYLGYLRRFGIAGALAIFICWLAAWAWFSGSVHNAIHWSGQKFYGLTADAGFVVDNILVEGRENTDRDV